VHGYICTADVDNLDAHVAKLVPSGGTLALPKMAIPTVGWLAYGKDTEGNIFGMMQADPNAK
jgi:predicted enzyme related to lactoylglutathione lyase